MQHFLKIAESRYGESSKVQKSSKVKGKKVRKLKKLKFELKSFFATQAGLPELANDIAGVMKEIDNDGSGAVDYREFIAATMSKKVS